LRSDGSVVAWGFDFHGHTNVTPLPGGTNYVRIAVGRDHSIACRSDGALVVWGSTLHGQSTVPPLPAGGTYLDASGGESHTVARRSDGDAVACGFADDRCRVPELPARWRFSAVTCGLSSSVYLATPSLGLAGGPSAGCRDIAVCDALTPPYLGNADFALRCDNATPNGTVFLATGFRALASPIHYANARVWIDPSIALFSVSHATAPLGEVIVPMPVPTAASLAGVTCFAQYLLIEDPACVPSGLSTSTALRFVPY
jgi:hypothetical protein